MESFVARDGAVSSALEPAERTVLARLFADAAELLGTRFTGDDADEVPADPPAPGDGDDAVLAALDFEPGGAPDAPADPALARLLPPMSADDPQLAAELRGLTETTLRARKVEHLQLVWRELRAPSGPGGAVVVRAGQEAAWLAAVNDVRLILAARLGVDDEDGAERVYARAHLAGTPSREAASREEEVTDALATMYTALTWWQESLLEALPITGDAG